MDNNDILFASLVGSKIVEMVPRLTQVQNELMKHVLPPSVYVASHPIQQDKNYIGLPSGYQRTLQRLHQQ